MTPVRVIMMMGNDKIVPTQTAEKNPGVLIVDIRYGRMVRDGAVVDVRPNIAKFVLALISRPGAIVSSEELFELLWGDRADGGPNRVDSLLTAYWPVVQTALVVLGYASCRHYGRGFSARPVERRTAAPIGIPRFLEARA